MTRSTFHVPIGKHVMKQNKHQRNQSSATQPDTDRVQINVLLEGEDAAKFLRFQKESKLRQKAAAGYRLITERLEQLEAA